MLYSDSEEFDVILGFDTGNTITQLHLMSNYCDKELKNLMTLESVDYGIQQSTPEFIPSSSHNQKIKVKFLIASRWKVREYSAEFWLQPSTTLFEACNTANRQLAYDLNASSESSNRKLASGSKAVTCDVVFIRPRVLAGDLNQTIGEVVTDQFLCFSNSIDCFRIQENSESVLAFQVVGGIIGICLAILILAVACA
ncbi:CIC11C00000002981 [Sungouiella intermedia]|uniref:CIC11C00000002981 n=1 Tax=Sungouiella intermedia TaxID=45354 RepID=A0A1L0DIG6_9ASCO|nr:CIC11C00000002981 [[Candida] intermedia]